MRNLLPLIVLVTVNSYSQTAQIDCPSKTKLKKDVSLGYLNYRGVQLGEIYTVSLNGNKIKSMTPLAKKDVDEKNIETSGITAEKHFDTKIDFTLSTSADMSLSLRTELKNKLNKELKFSLFNSMTKMVKNPFLQIDYYDPNVFPVKLNEVYVIINRVTIADSLVISTKTGLALDARVKVRLGEYEVEIVNNCSELLQIKGRQVPVFFEFRVFRATKVSKAYSDKIANPESESIETNDDELIKWEELKGIELEENPQN